MTVSDADISDLQRSLLNMNAIANFISKIIDNFPMSPDKQYDDLRALLSTLLQLGICNFMEEHDFLGNQLKNSEEIEVLRVLKPLFKPIKENYGMREFRNKVIAHMGHRDKKGRPSYAPQIIVEKKLPQNYGEMMFLGYCVIFFVERLRKYFQAEVADAEKKYLSYIEQFDAEARRQYEKGIKSEDELKEKLKDILKEVDARESKMRI